MSQAPALPRTSTRQYLRVSNVDWRTYSSLLRIFAERPGYRLTYDRGELEIMSPSMEHEDGGELLGDMVYVMTDEMGLPLKRGGSTTLRRQLRRRGIEADQCFWIANAHRLAGRRRLDLRRDPPPDLAIEVDVTNSSLNRLAIYARLGVPEVWRLEDATLTFFGLTPRQRYNEIPVSVALPLVAPADLLQPLQLVGQGAEENGVLRQFRAWFRQRMSAGPTIP